MTTLDLDTPWLTTPAGLLRMDGICIVVTRSTAWCYLPDGTYLQAWRRDFPDSERGDVACIADLADELQPYDPAVAPPLPFSFPARRRPLEVADA